MAAVALQPRLLDEHPHAHRRLWAHAREAGLLTRLLSDGLALAPPLTTTTSELETMITAVEHALAALADEHPA